jgi:hypothetical protein
MKALPVKWVFKEKFKPDGSHSLFKARLVVKGFMQQHGVDYEDVFAPVGSAGALRSMTAMAARNGWVMRQIDFKQAFLNGDLSEVVYIEQPQGFDDGTGRVYLLHKSLYGLKQAPRAWYTKLRDCLLSLGYKQSDADAGVFFRNKGGGVWLLLYVDDKLLMGPNDTLVKQAIAELGSRFVITDMGEAHMYLGVEITRTSESIKLTQKRYTLSLLSKYGVPLVANGGKVVPTPAIPRPPVESMATASASAAHNPFAELTGALLYLATWTRPDIAFAVNRLTRCIQSPTMSDWGDAQRVLKYLASSHDKGLVYTRGRGGGELVGYCDADFAADVVTRKSISGYVFYLNGGPISWSSKQQPTVARSTLESEYMAASSATSEALWLRNFLPELGYVIGGPVKIFGDNKGALTLLKDPVCSSRTKHIDTIHKHARERVQLGHLAFDYVESANNVADIFTKVLSPTAFEPLKARLVR